jgi:hypothetical protein
MEKILKDLTGKKLDISCSSSIAIRGENIGVSDGILQIRDEEDKTYFIAISLIVAVSQVSDSATRPGFIV